MWRDSKDTTVAKQNDLVRCLKSGDSVRNHDCRPCRHHAIQGLVDEALTTRIQCACCYTAETHVRYIEARSFPLEKPSSRMSKRGFLRMARAIASRCF